MYTYIIEISFYRLHTYIHTYKHIYIHTRILTLRHTCIHTYISTILYIHSSNPICSIRSSMTYFKKNYIIVTISVAVFRRCFSISICSTFFTCNSWILRAFLSFSRSYFFPTFFFFCAFGSSVKPPA